MTAPPETLLQFGAGNFLRAFADLFLHEANAVDDVYGRAVVVTSTDSPRGGWIAAGDGRYHVLLRGLRDGSRVDDTVHVERALSRCLPAARAWGQVLAVARSADLRWIVSNTTEAGFALDSADANRGAAVAALGAAADLLEDGATTRGSATAAALLRSRGGASAPGVTAPRSFPAKLLAVLAVRFHAGAAPVAVLPCELVEDNGPALLDLLRAQAEAWNLAPEVLTWIAQDCAVASTLVDRIVSGRPEAHPLLDEDPLLTAAEPYASWVVEARPGLELFPHPALRVVDEVADYALRKVRILNGAHTALVCYARPLALETVADAVAHPVAGPWLRQLLFDEIVPTVADRVVDAEGFAEDVLERFANPFLAHRLADIALHQETKVGTRLLPTWREHRELFGTAPPQLDEILRPYL